MASLHRRPNSRFWYCAYTDGEDRRVFRSTGETNKTKACRVALALEDAAREARKGYVTSLRLRKLVNQTVAGLTGKQRDDETIECWFRNWTKGKALSCAEGTGDRYTGLTEEFLGFLGPKAERDISDLTVFDIQRFRDDRLASGHSPDSVNLAVKTIRTCMRTAVKQQLIDSNPADAIDLLPKGEKIKKAFTREQVGQILEVADEEWEGLIKFGYYIGARLQNCARAVFDQVDLENALFRYVPVKQRKKAVPKSLAVPIHPELLEYLLARRKTTGPIFPRLSRMRIGGKTGLSLTFRSLMEKAGVVCAAKPAAGPKGRQVFELGFHSLRHAFNSDLANCGVSQEIRQKLIGHASKAVNDGYTALEISTFRKAIDQLPRFSK